MARTAVTVTTLTANSKIVKPGTNAIDVANGHTIPVAGQSGRLVMEIANTFAGAKNLTIKVGVNPPAFRASADLVIALTASSTNIVSLIESAAYIQADGSIWMDFEAATTGTIIAYLVP